MKINSFYFFGQPGVLSPLALFLRLRQQKKELKQWLYHCCSMVYLKT